jgi:hypothetical protein
VREKGVSVVCGGKVESVVVNISIATRRMVLSRWWYRKHRVDCTYLFRDDESLFMRDGES